jgi:hypothetical protein
MLNTMDTPSSPSAEVREALTGFHIGYTVVPGHSELHRIQLLEQCTDLKTTAWTISTIRTHILSEYPDPSCSPTPIIQFDLYTSSKSLPGMMDKPTL